MDSLCAMQHTGKYEERTSASTQSWPATEDVHASWWSQPKWGGGSLLRKTSFCEVMFPRKSAACLTSSGEGCCGVVAEMALHVGVRGWARPTLATTYFGHDLLWPRPVFGILETEEAGGGPKGGGPKGWGPKPRNRVRCKGGPHRGGDPHLRGPEEFGPKLFEEWEPGAQRGGDANPEKEGPKGGGPKGGGPNPEKVGGPQGGGPAGGGRRVGGPEGWGARRVGGPEGWGARRVGGPKGGGPEGWGPEG